MRESVFTVTPSDILVLLLFLHAQLAVDIKSSLLHLSVTDNLMTE